MTNYLSAARTLDELMLELIQKEIDIPEHVAGDLKLGRSFASIYARQPDEDIAMKTAIALQNVEMNLLALTEECFGRETAEEWQCRIIDAYQDENVSIPEQATASKFVSGVPKGEYWIRLQTDYLASIGDVEKLPAELSAITQEDGYTLIHGRKEDISAFLKEIREKIKKDGMG